MEQNPSKIEDRPELRFVTEEFIMMLAGLSFYSPCQAYQFHLNLRQDRGELKKFGLPANCEFFIVIPETVINSGSCELGSYSIFADGSLYFQSSAGDQVWPSAFDFCQKNFSKDRELGDSEAQLCKFAGWEF